MIKFFRKIRQRLLTENKFSKYLIYAIGEIILVVIGILIALSINNWNEAQRDRSFEVKMLKEINLALKIDIEYFKLMSTRVQTLNSNADFFINYIAGGNSYNDSLYNKIFGLNSGISIQYNRGPYDALKASGIDKISSDSVRNELIYFYDFSYPKFISSLEHYNRNHTKDIETIVGLQNDPEILLINNKANIIQGFPDDIFEQTDFLKTLRSIKFRSNRLNTVMGEFIPDIEKLINRFEAEIK